MIKVLRLVFKTPTGFTTHCGTFTNMPRINDGNQLNKAVFLYEKCLKHEKVRCVGYVVEGPKEKIITVPEERITKVNFGKLV